MRRPYCTSVQFSVPFFWTERGRYISWWSGRDVSWSSSRIYCSSRLTYLSMKNHFPPPARDMDQNVLTSSLEPSHILILSHLSLKLFILIHIILLPQPCSDVFICLNRSSCVPIYYMISYPPTPDSMKNHLKSKLLFHHNGCSKEIKMCQRDQTLAFAYLFFDMSIARQKFNLVLKPLLSSL